VVFAVLLYIWEPMRTVADEMERREWVYRFILVLFHLVGGRGSVLSKEPREVVWETENALDGTAAR
jgi:hypothetical protein